MSMIKWRKSNYDGRMIFGKFLISDAFLIEEIKFPSQEDQSKGFTHILKHKISDFPNYNFKGTPDELKGHAESLVKLWAYDNGMAIIEEGKKNDAGN